MSSLLEESAAIWRAGGPLMIPLSILAFGLFFAQTRLLLRLRRAGVAAEPEPSEGAESTQARISSRFAAERRKLLAPIDRRIRFYAILIGICPLLGLLGTVAGMTSTFEGIARPGLSDLSGEVAGGISEALVTTQAGLLVAIPGMILLALLRRGRERVALGSFNRESRALDRSVTSAA